ncbi:MAG: hypothetical protein RJA61_458 [Candidatus Parcubacteria bacterium]
MSNNNLVVPKDCLGLRSPVCISQDPEGVLQCSKIPGACQDCPGLCKRLALGEVVRSEEGPTCCKKGDHPVV